MGAQWPTITRLTFLEATAACVLGAIVGAALGALAVVAIARHASLPVGRTVGHALTAATGGALLLVGLAIALTVAVLLWPDTERRTAWRSLDLAAIVALGTAVLLTSRGAVATGELSTRSDPLLVALPVLAAVTAGLVAARIWLPAARLAERVIPRRSVAGRIALLGAVRRPLRAVATTAFLTAAVASVVFAGAYRSTLLQGSADQAAYAVPLDATLRSSASVPTPLALTSPAQIAALAPGIHAYGVVRSSGVVRTGVGDSVGLPVLGVDPASLEQVRRWSRTTGSDRSPASVAKTLQPTGSVAATPVLPAGTKVVSLAVSGQLADTEVDLWLSTSAGRETAVSLKRNKAGDTLSGKVPARRRRGAARRCADHPRDRGVRHLSPARDRRGQHRPARPRRDLRDQWGDGGREAAHLGLVRLGLGTGERDGEVRWAVRGVPDQRAARGRAACVPRVDRVRSAPRGR